MEGKLVRLSKIGDIALYHPEAVAVLLEHGFHCIGCDLSAYETVEEGARQHGFDDAEIDMLVEKMNDAIEAAAKEVGKGNAAKIVPIFDGKSAHPAWQSAGGAVAPDSGKKEPSKKTGARKQRKKGKTPFNG